MHIQTMNTDEQVKISGEQVKAARERIGESQTAFARRFGVDQATVHRWENRGVPDGTAQIAVQRVLQELKGAAA